jgi:signal transduction histidine kinase
MRKPDMASTALEQQKKVRVQVSSDNDLIPARREGRESGGQLAEHYWGILQEYLKDRSEASLNRGYELARQAFADGCGVLEMADIHHRALRRLCAEAWPDDQLLWAVGDFFAGCFSPFEMSHRGAQEGTRALRHLNEVLENEVKRIAHALHDEAGQLLASVHIAVVDIASELPPQARIRFEEVERLLTQIEVELRNLSHELRPTVLDNLGLVAALEFLAEKVSKRTGLNVSVTGDAGARLPATVETTLYRIVQEALNNAVKHAQARSVRIELRRTPLKVTCSVGDDGHGFDAHRQPDSTGLGLIGMRERLDTLGGALCVITRPRCGTTIQAEIPLGG